MVINMQYFANKNIPKMTDRELKKSIDSWNRRIAEHRSYLKDPLPHCPNWELFDERYRNGLMDHWEHEIKTLEADIRSAAEELERRENYDKT